LPIELLAGEEPVDLRWAKLEIDRLDQVRRSAESAAAAYVRALTAAARAGRRAAPAPAGLRASRAELLRHHVELRHRLDRVANLAFPSPCEAAPLAFAFAAARETLTAIERLSLRRLRRVRGGTAPDA
jgi:hypothetical protein